MPTKQMTPQWEKWVSPLMTEVCNSIAASSMAKSVFVYRVPTRLAHSSLFWIGLLILSLLFSMSSPSRPWAMICCLLRMMSTSKTLDLIGTLDWTYYLSVSAVQCALIASDWRLEIMETNCRNLAKTSKASWQLWLLCTSIMIMLGVSFHFNET